VSEQGGQQREGGRDDEAGQEVADARLGDLEQARPDQQTAGGASNGGAAYALSYGYDGAGHTTSIVNPVGQGVPLTGPSQGDPKAMHTTFAYDAQGRVTQVVYLERAAATGATTALTPTTVQISYNAAGQRAQPLVEPSRMS